MKLITIGHDKHGLYVKSFGAVFRPQVSQGVSQHINNISGVTRLESGLRVGVVRLAGAPHILIRPVFDHAKAYEEWWYFHGNWTAEMGTVEVWNPDCQVLKDKRMTAQKMASKGGAHYRVMREFIQRRFRNGDHAIWGSHEHLEPGARCLTVAELEQLACEIASESINDYIEDAAREQRFAEAMSHLRGSVIAKVLTSVDPASNDTKESEA